ncbi:putative head closure protein [Methylophilales phage MEP402]|nr:putative head closure protein [Methylophilales phage MEP402]
MAQKAEKAYRSFVKGLVTEANQLTFPENASIDEANFVLNRDGSRSRRLGVDYESSYALTATGLTATDIKEGKQSFHVWESPGGDTTVSLGLVRIKDKIWFMNLLTDSPSANLKNGGSPITIASLSNNKIETSVINNKCVIVSKDLPRPVLLTYTKATGLVTQSTIQLEIRDIYGVDDSLFLDTRPTTLSNEHKYNLRNQGWNKNIVTSTGADAIDYTFTELGQYPSNADNWTLGKISNTASADYEKYDPDTLVKNSFSNYQIAKGSFIIDAFERGVGRMNKSDVTSGLPTDREEGNISTITSYAQRLFYSGVESNVTGGDIRSPNYSGYIFFSKIIKSDDDLGKCHQEADPTDPGINDLIDTDGGSIQIPDITRVVKIIASQASVLVFAENGVWEVYGDTGGFIATSFQASKISTNGITNGDSVVNVNGNFIYWSKAGIYLLKPDTASGRFAAESLSLTSIQDLYLKIPEVAKDFCKGIYDEKENRVRYLYNDSADYSSSNYPNSYNKELIYDLTLKAWSKNELSSLASDSPYVADYVAMPGYSVSSREESVVAGTDTVLVTAGDTVVIPDDVATSRTEQFSFLTIVGTSFTLSKYNGSDFLDWKTKDSVGVDYSSYLYTGYELFGDIMRQKQIPYIFLYLQKTEDGFQASGDDLIFKNQSSCKVQAQWGWSNSVANGKWGKEFQAYRILRNYTPSGASDAYDSGESMVVTKNKLRGSGKCLSLYIRSEQGKDMKLLGWGHPVTMLSIV